jgi:hypothetical protein
LIEIIRDPLGIESSEFDIIQKKMGNIDMSATHVRGPGGDQGPAFIQIPFGTYQPDDDEPPQGFAHFASACVYATPRAYCQVLQAVSSSREEWHCHSWPLVLTRKSIIPTVLEA